MKKRISEKNHETLLHYEQQLAKAKTRKEKAERAVLRAALVLGRARSKMHYIERQIRGVNEAAEAGIPFRKTYQKKAERAISFD